MGNLNNNELLINNNFNKLIRHYKIIKRNNYDDTVEEEIKSSKNYKHDVCVYNYVDALSQDTDNYDNKSTINYILINNTYKNNSLIKQCYDHKNYVLNGKHYDDLNNLKTDLKYKNNEALIQYMTDIENDDFDIFELIDLKNTIRDYANGTANNLYIRMAPNKDEKDNLLQRLYFLQNIELLIGSDGTKYYLKDGLPVYNDNIIYSKLKYDIITSKSVKDILNSIDENLDKKIEEL